MVHSKHRSSSSGRRQPCVDAWEVSLGAADSKGHNTWVTSLILAIWLSRTHFCLWYRDMKSDGDNDKDGDDDDDEDEDDNDSPPIKS